MEALNFLSVEQMQTLKDLGLEMKITPYAYYKTRKKGEWEIKADNGYSTGGIYSSKEEAEKQKDIDCVATIKIEWEE